MSYHLSNTADRFPFEVKTRSKAQERTWTRIFNRVPLRSLLYTLLTLSVGFALTLTGNKWESSHTHSYLGAIFLVAGLIILAPGLYWLADLLGLLRNLHQEYSGSAVMPQEDPHESEYDGDAVRL